MKLWIPPESDFVKNTEWLVNQFGEGYRVQYLLITAEDVLQRDVLLKVNFFVKYDILVIFFYVIVLIFSEFNSSQSLEVTTSIVKRLI